MTPEELDAMTDEQLYDHLRQHTDGSLDPVIARLEAGHMLARDIARDAMAETRRIILAEHIADHEQMQQAILDAQALAEEWADRG